VLNVNNLEIILTQTNQILINNQSLLEKINMNIENVEKLITWTIIVVIAILMWEVYSHD